MQKEVHISGSATTPAAAAPTILIVEDEAAIALDLRFTLESLGYRVANVAISAEEALDFVGKHSPDLILMDIVLRGDRDGIAAAQEIYNRWRIPVVFCTANSDPETTERIKMAQPFGFLFKPYQTRELKIIIESALYKSQAEKKQRESEERFRGYFELGLIGMAITSLEKGWVQFNDRLCEILGYSREELNLKTWAEITHPDDIEADVVQYDRVLRGEINGYRMEKRFIRKDASIVYTEISAQSLRRVDGSVDHFVAMVQDISERKQAEEALRESVARFQQVMENIQEVFWLSSPDWKQILYISPAYEKVWGRPCEDLYGAPLSWLESVVEEDRQTLQQAIPPAVKPDFQMRFPDYRITRPDGTIRWISARAFPVLDESGTVVRMAGIAEDITERKQAEEALRESERQHRSILKTAMDGFWQVNSVGRIVEVNDAYCRMSGYDEQELLSMGISDLEDIETAAETAARIQKVIRTGEDRFESRHRRKDGSLFDLEISIQYRPAEGGHFIGFLRDITERKQAEEALRESERKNKAWIENSPVCTKILDLDFNLQYMSSSGIRELKIEDINEFYGKPYPLYFYPDSFKIPMRNNLTKAKETGEIIRQEASVVDIDGNELWYHSTIVPVNDDRGKLDYVLVVSLETTERKQAEEDLKRQRYFLAKAQEIGHIGTWELDTIKNILVWTDENYRVFGVPIGTPLTYEIFLSCLHPDDREYVDQEWKAALNHKPYDIEHRLIVNDSIKWVREKAELEFDDHGKCIRAVGFTQDITERKQAESEVLQAHQQTLSILESITDAFFSLDHNLVVTYFNSAALKALGRCREEVMERPLFDSFPEARGSIFEEQYTRALREQIPLSFETYFGIAPYDNWYDVRVYPYARGISVYFNVTTERKRAEEKLREINGRLLLATASAKAGVWDWNLQTGEMIWDDRMFELYGLRRENFCGGVEAWEQGLHPDDASRAKEECQAALRGERNFDTEFRVRRPDGTTVHIKANGLVLHDERGKGHRMIGLNTDITERKSLEGQLRQAQKIESIGQLAGGIAHDYNNILAATMMQLSFLLTNEKLDEETKDSLKQLMEDSQRAANLTRQLLMFSRRSVLEVKTLDLNDLIANLLKMLGRVIGEHISVRFDQQGSLPPVEADPGMIEQVIMNLAINARDAMPNGGTLSIRVAPVQLDEHQAKADIRSRPGLFVCLSVKDTGCGMDEATLKRIFEPFFTTKEVGKGTGLGLATVEGIVAQHKGWINVDSKPDSGTTFRIFLPAKSLEEAVASGRQGDQTPILRGTETILYVEDESILRRVVAQSLRTLGYGVLEAENGQEAMKLWQKHSARIALLFSDMVMPEGMTGVELAQKMRNEKPSLKVIITSGYNIEQFGKSKPTAGGIVYLQKPYDAQTFSLVIRSCLDIS